MEARGDAAGGIVYDDENLTVSKYLDRWLSDAVRGTVRESAYYGGRTVLNATPPLVAAVDALAGPSPRQ